MSIQPKTYAEIVTFAACRTFSKHFQVSEGQMERFFHGLLNGEIRQIVSKPYGMTTVQRADGDEKLFLPPSLDNPLSPEEVRTVTLTANAFSRQYSEKYLARTVSSSGGSSGGGSSNNNNNNNNNNH